jgi:hypothetical protein
MSAAVQIRLPDRDWAIAGVNLLPGEEVIVLQVSRNQLCGGERRDWALSPCTQGFHIQLYRWGKHRSSLADFVSV